MQRGRIASPMACKLGTEAREVARESLASCLRTRAAQQRQFERFGRALECAGGAAQPAQRMLQQRQQDRRLKLVCCRLCGEPSENSYRCVHQRVAAGIVEREIPAVKRRAYSPRQRAIGSYERRRFIQMPRFAHRDRNRKRLRLRIIGFDHGDVCHREGNFFGDRRFS